MTERDWSDTGWVQLALFIDGNGDHKRDRSRYLRAPRSAAAGDPRITERTHSPLDAALVTAATWAVVEWGLDHPALSGGALSGAMNGTHFPEPLHTRRSAALSEFVARQFKMAISRLEPRGRGGGRARFLRSCFCGFL